MSQYWMALGLTLLVELVVVVGWCSVKRYQSISPSGLWLLVAGINGITHPGAWWCYSQGWLDWWWLEVAVTALESVGLCSLPRFSWRSACGISLAANAASFLMGCLALSWSVF